MKKKTKSLAFAGILSALAVVILLLGSLIDVLDLSAAALASLVVMVAVLELGNRWALGVYVTASVLSVLLMPRTASVVFAAFIGGYPVWKVYLDRIKPRILQYAAKLLLFNAFLTLALWICKQLIGASNEWLELGKLLYLLANPTFLLFDFAIGQLSVYYLTKLKNRMHRNNP